MASCRPSWVTRLHPDYNVTLVSGCPTYGGNVQCNPYDMVANAQDVLSQLGIPGNLDLETYTLARYITSEVGNGRPEERLAVALAAIQQANKRGINILSLLLYVQPPGHPNFGYFGPGPDAHTGRWAATSQDPTVENVLISRYALSGDAWDFANGADDQVGPDVWLNWYGTQGGYDFAVKNIRKPASGGGYWVGPIVGVNPWRTWLYKHTNIDPNTPQGQQLIAAGIDALNTPSAQYDAMWDSMPVCAPSPLEIIRSNTLVAVAVTGLFVAGLWYFFDRGYDKKLTNLLPEF